MKLCRQHRVLRCRCSYAGRYIRYTVLTLMCLYLMVWDCKKLQVSVARRTLMLNHRELVMSSQSTLNLMVLGHCLFESFHWKLTDHSGIWPNSSKATLLLSNVFDISLFRGVMIPRSEKSFWEQRGHLWGSRLCTFIRARKRLCQWHIILILYIYIYYILCLIDQQWWMFMDFQQWPHGACVDFSGHVSILLWGWSVGMRKESILQFCPIRLGSLSTCFHAGNPQKGAYRSYTLKVREIFQQTIMP